MITPLLMIRSPLFVQRTRLAASGIVSAALLAVVAACGDNSTAPQALVGNARVLLGVQPSAPGPNYGVADVEYFEVCKEYPSGSGPDVTIDVAVSGGTTSNFQVTLSAGQCKDIWITGGGVTDVVTVTEQVPSGYTASYVKQTAVRSSTPGSPTRTTYPAASGNTASGNTGGTPVGGTLIKFINTPIPPTGEIGDFVWYDVNGNGVQDAAEPGIDGVTVTLGGAASATTTTANGGQYKFTGLVAGSYTVTVATPAGFLVSPSAQGGNTNLDSNGSPANVTLATNSSTDYSIDFGFTKRVGAIGDFVWHDLNANGVQDAGEPGIAGVTVTMSGAASGTTTTDANGAYLFSGLGAGNYTVTVGTPSGFTPSPSAQGGNTNLDSNGSPANVTLAGNASTDLSIDFGFVENKTGQIGDFVWYDVNGNGVQDAGEPGIAGVSVTLGGAASGSTTTDANGKYIFTGLGAGGYTVTVGAPAGYVASPSAQGGNANLDSNGSPANVTLATNSSSDLSIDFGYTKGTGTIGNFVWNDLNKNGIQDAGEPGIAGVTVTLGGAASGTATTNGSGAYLFSGLFAGNYTVTVGSVSGYTPTAANQGGDPTKDSNANPSNVTLASNNSNDLTIDFGFFAVGTVQCTLTQGYWKTHQEKWDAAGEMVVWTGQTFFNSGKTYAEIYAMSAAGGNSYIQLAHQYMAAKLNVNSGSDPLIDGAIAQAEALLGAHTAGSSFIKNATWTALAGSLAAYNEGSVGPGHCD